jgi:ketosteroid isomerase-like protein
MDWVQYCQASRERLAAQPRLGARRSLAFTEHDGKPYVNTYAWFLDMQAGDIVEASAFFDSIEFNDLWSRVRPAQELAQ